jgi:capsular exopolysaccharide synthesis family protein
VSDPLPLEEPQNWQAQQPSSSFRVGHMLAVLRRKWWIPFVTLAMSLPVGIAYVRTRPDPGYVSEARMWVRGTLRLNEIAQFSEDAASSFGTQIALMQSDQMKARALERLRSLDAKFEIPRDAHGRFVSADLDVSQVKGAAMFVLECSSQDAKYAQDFLNALMDEYLEYRDEVRAATAGDFLASLSEELYKQERSLKAEQEKLAGFQKDNNVVLLEEQVRGGGNQLAQLYNQIAMLELDMSLLEAAALERTMGQAEGPNLNSLSFDPAGVLPATATPVSVTGEISTTKRRLETLRLRREQLSRNLKPRHPKIIAVNQQMEDEQRLLDSLTRQTQAELATSREARKMRIVSLKAAAAELEPKVAEASRLHAEYSEIRTNIERQQSLYDQLLGLLRSVDMNRSMDQESVAVLERAGPASAIEQKPLKVLIGILFAGWMAGFGIVFLLSRLDDRCDSIEDIRAEFQEEVFGQIPDVKRERADRRPVLLLTDENHQVFLESCRSMRSTLMLGHRNGNCPRAISVTSAVPDEGKSTIAVNLAQALSVGGARVLLVDADLRRGRLHEILGRPPGLGLTDLIRDEGQLGEYATPTDHPNLTLLARGTPTKFTGELFLTPAFDRFLSDAKQSFHYVIFDTVPVFAADDATTLAPKTDGVLFVVRRAYTSAKLAQEALEMLYQRRASVLGIVFNRANADARSYRYYKYSRYHVETSGV